MPILRHAMLCLVAVSAVAPAQMQSRGFKFLEAIRESKNDEVIAMLDQPGQTIVNARDISTGEGALHIVVKRGDMQYLNYLLTRGADVNMRDGRGETPLLLAVQYGHDAMIEPLIKRGANPNLGNSGGETPLIRAVQKRDLELVRTLLAQGADPDQTDALAGMSARDYAKNDPRNPAVAKLIEQTPKKVRRAVAGPRL